MFCPPEITGRDSRLQVEEQWTSLGSSPSADRRVEGFTVPELRVTQDEQSCITSLQPGWERGEPEPGPIQAPGCCIESVRQRLPSKLAPIPSRHFYLKGSCNSENFGHQKNPLQMVSALSIQTRLLSRKLTTLEKGAVADLLPTLIYSFNGATDDRS